MVRTCKHTTKNTKNEFPRTEKPKQTPTPEIYTGESEEEKRMMNGKHQLTNKLCNKIYAMRKWTTRQKLPPISQAWKAAKTKPKTKHKNDTEPQKYTQKEIKDTKKCIKNKHQTPRDQPEHTK